MKAEDLMIGDWVIRRGVPEEPMRVYDIKASAGIAFLEQDGRGVTEKFENIEPISLTPEILKKNGFIYADLPFEDFYEGYGLQIHGGNYADGHSNWYISCGINVSMNVTYVHRLQRALKLCEIEKEIIL